jgi:long-chain acyl-CoA synthetase
MESIISFFKKQTQKFPNNPLLWEKQNDTFTPLSYNEAYQKVKQLALGFKYFGITQNDRIALLSEGRNLWLLCELAVLSNRAITVPLSTKLEADNDLVFRLKHSESSHIIVSKNQLNKIRSLKRELSDLKKIIVFDNSIELEDDEVCIEMFINKGEEILKNNPNAFDELTNSVNPNDIATITYTSGTTAQPKGIMLSHRNYTANVEQAFSYIDIPPYFRTLVVLPWDHAFAHTAALYAFMLKGASVASVQVGKTPLETLKNFTNNIKEIKPHILMSVPAMAKNFKKNIEKSIEQKGKAITVLFNTAVNFTSWYNGNGHTRGKGIKFITKPILTLFNKIIFSKIKEGFGGNLQYFIGGGALLDYDLQQFFYAIGIPMYQGYGLSEASPIISANTPIHHKLGSSGKVVNNLKIKIVDEERNNVGLNKLGEIAIKGENVMKGYWKNQEATTEVICNEWLYTGDLGYLDDDNYLYVKGRFKCLLISSDGEKYSPEGIEEALIDHCPLIDQIMLYNNQNPYTIALIVPNVDAIKKLITSSNGKENIYNHIILNIEQQVNQFKEGGKNANMFPQRWLPSTFAIAHEEFSERNKLINSTMKVVRDKVVEFFNNEINICYTPQGKSIVNETNINNLKELIQKCNN